MRCQRSRLLLLSRDELLALWDALVMAGGCFDDVGDPAYDDIKRIRERVAELLSGDDP